LLSEIIERNGDCSSCTESPRRSVSSNTGARSQPSHCARSARGSTVPRPSKACRPGEELHLTTRLLVQLWSAQTDPEGRSSGIRLPGMAADLVLLERGGERVHRRILLRRHLLLRSDPRRDRGGAGSGQPPSVPDRSGGAPCRVAERRHTVAVGARRSSDTSGAIVEGGDAVAIGARAAGDASLGVVEANVLGLGGRERGKRGQECDGDDSHGRRFCDVLVMTPTLARSQRAGQAECPPTSPMFQFGSSLNDFLYRDWVGLARFAPSFASALAA